MKQTFNIMLIYRYLLITIAFGVFEWNSDISMDYSCIETKEVLKELNQEALNNIESDIIINLDSVFKISDYQYIIGLNLQDSTIASIVDIGWGGAVDGPAWEFRISEISFKGKIVDKLYNQIYFNNDFKNIKEWQQSQLDTICKVYEEQIISFLSNNNIQIENQRKMSIRSANYEDFDFKFEYKTILSDWGEELNVFECIIYRDNVIWKDFDESEDCGAVQIVSMSIINNDIGQMVLKFVGDNLINYESVLFSIKK